MRRGVIVAVALVAVLAAVTGATARSAAHAGTTKAQTITIWVGWSDRELKAFKSIVAEYGNKHPDVPVKVVGYTPFLGFYAGNAPDLSAYAPLFGAKYVDGSGHSVLSKDTAWSRMLTGQKSMVDWYGYMNLQKFDAGAADEFSASHAFEIGKLAMMMDGEWRVAFVKAEHPSLDYATAPAPVDDAKPNLYGAGAVNGTIIGIPKGVKHKDQARALLKYRT